MTDHEREQARNKPVLAAVIVVFGCEAVGEIEREVDRHERSAITPSHTAIASLSRYGRIADRPHEQHVHRRCPAIQPKNMLRYCPCLLLVAYPWAKL
jgi:hypothetical protein